MKMVGVQNEKYTRELPPMEMCRTRAIAAMEITSEQVAKSKLGAALVFGVLGGVTAMGSIHRATVGASGGRPTDEALGVLESE